MRNDTSLLQQTVLSALGSYHIQTGGTCEQHRHPSLHLAQHPPASAVSRLEVGCKNYFCGQHGRSFFLTSPFIGHFTPNGVKTRSR